MFNSNLIIYMGSELQIITTDEFSQVFKCEKIGSKVSNNPELANTQFSIPPDIKLPVFNIKTKIISFKSLKKFFIYEKVKSSFQINGFRFDEFLVGTRFSLPLVAHRSNKVIVSNGKINNNTNILQTNIFPLDDKIISSKDGFEINSSLGYLIGYWIGRGSIQKFDKYTLAVVFKVLKEKNDQVLKQLSKTATTVCKQDEKNENFNNIMVIDHDLQQWLVTNFGSKSNNKTIPNWSLLTNQEFLVGMLHGLVHSTSFISINETKGLSYLIIKTFSEDLTKTIPYVLKTRFGIIANIIKPKPDDEHGMYKICYRINDKIFDLLQIDNIVTTDITGELEKFIFKDKTRTIFDNNIIELVPTNICTINQQDMFNETMYGFDLHKNEFLVNADGVLLK